MLLFSLTDMRSHTGRGVMSANDLEYFSLLMLSRIFIVFAVQIRSYLFIVSQHFVINVPRLHGIPVSSYPLTFVLNSVILL